MSERVQLTIDNHVATVRMSRPEKRNALDADMFDGLIRMGKRIIADKSVRASPSNMSASSVLRFSGRDMRTVATWLSMLS